MMRKLWRKDSHRTYLAVLILLVSLAYLHGVIPESLWGFTGDLTKDPSDVVKTYLRLDSKGVRLEAISQETLRPYIDWSEEPRWGKVIVTKQYEVVDDVEEWEIINSLEMRIPVIFNVLGTLYWETGAFVEHLQTEHVWFHVKGFEDRWRIIAPQIPPHVTVKRMVNVVRQAILDEPQPQRKDILAQLRKELERMKE